MSEPNETQDMPTHVLRGHTLLSGGGVGRWNSPPLGCMERCGRSFGKKSMVDSAQYHRNTSKMRAGKYFGFGS